MQIREIKNKWKREEFEISFHAEKERYAEEISLKDLETAIMDGEILEGYPHDPRGPSCLLLGYSGKRPLHILCGFTSHKWLRIITVYIPKLPKWIDERTRAKGGEANA